MKVLNAQTHEFESIDLKKGKKLFFDVFKKNVIRNRIVLVHGMPSTGKSTFVNSKMNVPVFDSDTVVELMAGDWNVWHQLCEQGGSAQDIRNEGVIVFSAALLKIVSTSGIIVTNMTLDPTVFNYIVSFGREPNVMERLFDERCQAGGFTKRDHPYQQWFDDWASWVKQAHLPLALILEDGEYISDLLPEGISTEKKPSQIKQIVDYTYIVRNEAIRSLFKNWCSGRERQSHPKEGREQRSTSHVERKKQMKGGGNENE